MPRNVTQRTQAVSYLMSAIPDFDENELRIVRNVVDERYGKKVGLQMADGEVKVDPQSEDLSWCPAVFWAEMGTSFVVFKIGNNKYRNMFYYRPNEQFGTGRVSYDNLEE